MIVHLNVIGYPAEERRFQQMVEASGDGKMSCFTMSGRDGIDRFRPDVSSKPVERQAQQLLVVHPDRAVVRDDQAESHLLSVHE